MTHLKKEDINNARNYEYNTGELASIAMKRFERCLRKNDLSGFSNVTYFQKLKLHSKKEKEEEL